MVYWFKPFNERRERGMREHGEEIQRLAEEFADCRKILQALGDANRQHLILKEAGLLRMRREGTKNYYDFDADTDAMRGLIQMLAHAKRIMEALPDRSGEEE